MLYILIPSLRDTEYLSKCISSINKTLHEPYILLVNYTWEKIGFPKAVNTLWRSALAQSDCDELVLLSNDVEILTDNWINMFRELDVWGMVGGQAQIGRVEGEAYYHHPHSEYPWYRRESTPYSGLPYKVIHTPFSFLYMRRSVLESVGFLDEGFSPGYYEDNDYGVRAWLKGFKSMVEPRIIYRHYLGYTYETHYRNSAWTTSPQAKYYWSKWSYLLDGLETPEQIITKLCGEGEVVDG